MTFLNAFFLVNFLPLGLIALAGILLFFIGKYKQEKWYYPLLFIILVIVVISLWRIPVIIDRRYAMPTMVPGIVISAFVLMLLPGILKKLKVPYANIITRVIIIGLLIACVAKAIRIQENKDYLHNIPEVIKLECQKNNIGGNVALLVFGNPGGHLDFDNNVKTVNINNRHLNDRLADIEYQFNLLQGALEPDALKIQYPHLYLLCVEQSTDSFSQAWEKRFKDIPELVFEFVHPKHQIAYRLYRIISHYQTAWYSEQKFNEFLKKYNVLDNGDFSKKNKCLPDNPAMQTLKQRGIDFFARDNVYLPEGWDIDPNAGWQKDCIPAGIEIKTEQDGSNQLAMHSMTTISIFSKTQIAGGQKYILFINGVVAQNAIVSVLEFQYAGNKYLRHNTILNFKQDMQKMLNAGFLDLSNLSGHARVAIYLSSGFAGIDKTYVIPMSAIKPAQ